MRAPGEIVQKGTYYELVQEGKDFGAFVEALELSLNNVIQVLFQLVEPAGGCILIDGLDITTIGLNNLRSALGVIPQEPTLFKGSVRSNMDPFNTSSEKQISESLDKCQLGQVVRDKPQKLNFPVSKQGENWSVGERQLLCLARALLKHPRILVLDEAAASMDITTDAFIQLAIKQSFADCTMISVSHRIPTVIDSDRVLVLDKGELADCQQIQPVQLYFLVH